jgi:hypothetical protein
MSGYYQASALQQRDLLETAFLLSYFQSDRALIAQWRGSDQRVRQKNFAPVVVRRALDDRDGFTERKRDKQGVRPMRALVGAVVAGDIPQC